MGIFEQPVVPDDALFYFCEPTRAGLTDLAGNPQLHLSRHISN